MNADDALRFLAHEVKRCTDRDLREAATLWVPALCKVLGLRPADDFEALAIQEQAHRELRALNESPLVEVHCHVCGFADTLPEVRFDPHCPTSGLLSWCAQCQGERCFTREAVPA